MPQHLFQNAPVPQRTEQHPQIVQQSGVPRNPKSASLQMIPCFSPGRGDAPCKAAPSQGSSWADQIWILKICWARARQAKVKLHHGDCVASHLHRKEHLRKLEGLFAMTKQQQQQQQRLPRSPHILMHSSSTCSSNLPLINARESRRWGLKTQ